MLDSPPETADKTDNDRSDYYDLTIIILIVSLVASFIILIGIFIFVKRSRDRDYAIIAKYNEEVEMTRILKDV